MRALVTASVLSALMLTGAAAAEKPKATDGCRVSVEGGGNDVVGRRLALALKERLKASPLYQLVDPNAPEGWYENISFSSLDVDVPPRGIRSAVAVRLTVPSGESCPATQVMVYLVGTDQVTAQAESIVADLEQMASRYHVKCSAP